MARLDQMHPAMRPPRCLAMVCPVFEDPSLGSAGPPTVPSGASALISTGGPAPAVTTARLRSTAGTSRANRGGLPGDPRRYRGA